MRLAAFSLSIIASTLCSASLIHAQSIYETADAGVAPIPVGGAWHMGYSYNYSNPHALPMGNSNWGYAGTCCSNIWSGYCEEEQGCHRGCSHGCNSCGGCSCGGLWCKLWRGRPKLFGSKGHCGCQQSCQQGGCGAEGCSTAVPFRSAESDAAETEQLMPLPPHPRRQPYDDAPSPGDETRSKMRKSYRMPQMTSARVKPRR